jgi:hypothetical protein
MKKLLKKLFAGISALSVIATGALTGSAVSVLESDAYKNWVSSMNFEIHLDLDADSEYNDGFAYFDENTSTSNWLNKYSFHQSRRLTFLLYPYR